MAENNIIKLVNGVREFQIVILFCNPGKYRIGNIPLYSKKNTTIEISQGFWLQEITVSLGLYEFVYGKPYYECNLSEISKSLFPWDSMDFGEILDFITRLNEIVYKNKLNFVFDLPSFVEWEHALLCGKDFTWAWGHEEAELVDYGWYKDNSDNKIHLSKQKKCNDWGLYDMYGNVHEYCYDCMMDSDKSYFLNPPILKPSNKDVLPCLGGAFDSNIDQCFRHNSMSYYNKFLEPTGFRLIIRE